MHAGVGKVDKIPGFKCAADGYRHIQQHGGLGTMHHRRCVIRRRLHRHGSCGCAELCSDRLDIPQRKCRRQGTGDTQNEEEGKQMAGES